MSTTKTCTECDKTKNLSDFVKHSSYKDGYMNICKPCENKKRNNKRNEKSKNLKIDLTKIKNCFQCKQDKIITEFGRSKSCDDGFRNKCLICCSLEQKNRKQNRKSTDIKEKNCRTCGELKKIDEFNINRSYSDIHESDCRICLNKKKNEYLNIPEIKEKHNESRRIWSNKPENKEKIKKDRQKPERKEKMREYVKKHISKPENKIKKNARKRERYQNDLNYKILHNLRSRLREAIYKKSDKSDKTLNLLGCSLDDFMDYLESLFNSDMNWENYGLEGWHLDHIRPCASFDLTKPTEQRICFNWRNIQPLWATENLQKNDKWEPRLWIEDIKKLRKY